MTGVLDRIGWWHGKRLAVPTEAPKCRHCGECLPTATNEESCAPCREDDAVRRALSASYHQSPRPGSCEKQGLRGKTILIVTGDRVLTRVLSTRLHDFGCRVVCAWDATHALSTARREEPDVIVMDQEIPGGDRMSILERMRNLAGLAFIPVVVLTDGCPDIRRLALLRGASACFPRVGRLEGLTAVLRESVN